MLLIFFERGAERLFQKKSTTHLKHYRLKRASRRLALFKLWARTPRYKIQDENC
jgi:hypothetical protein